MCLFTHSEIYEDINSVMHTFVIHALHYLSSVFLEGPLWRGIISVSSFTLAVILKCRNNQSHHVNTTCMPYDCSAALCIFWCIMKTGLNMRTRYKDYRKTWLTYALVSNNMTTRYNDYWKILLPDNKNYQ